MAYNGIDDVEIRTGKPVVTSLFARLRDDVISMFSGDSPYRLSESAIEDLTLSVGNVPISDASNRVDPNANSYKKTCEIAMLAAGSVRVRYWLQGDSVTGDKSYAEIRKNGVAIAGTQKSTAGRVIFSSDVSGLVAGDRLQLYTYGELEATGTCEGFQLFASQAYRTIPHFNHGTL